MQWPSDFQGRKFNRRVLEPRREQFVIRQPAQSRGHEMVLLDYRTQNSVRLHDLLLRGEIVLHIHRVGCGRTLSAQDRGRVWRSISMTAVDSFSGVNRLETMIVAITEKTTKPTSFQRFRLTIHRYCESEGPWNGASLSIAGRAKRGETGLRSKPFVLSFGIAISSLRIVPV